MSHDSSNPTYWIPSWWDWMSNWSDCATCLQYNGTPCASCEIPPGLLALAQLVGGGTATVAGSMRGNCGIANAQQAQAAATQHGSAAVAHQFHQQKASVTTDNGRLEGDVTDVSLSVQYDLEKLNRNGGR